ncbi:glycosyltransferase family 9 protein [Actinoallomurus purpureus]|uniref:glycosyltransferase family 9 protein n=1 Tax=Actinoallomurus purpureus TaxID=478114 RepID=UPI002093D863|nr:glycosyltransferase family 9 protein [Actinoallomurus purpureus]MCO6003771.1 glycosyltransferase family 9 protein [Actinoallomurus purpureus]
MISTPGARPVGFEAVPESPATWLDDLGDGRVEVHAALPMRYYLNLEQALGLPLPEQRACLPAFTSQGGTRDPFHVVFIATTSWPDRKDYGAASFSEIAVELVRRRAAPWRFSVITADTASPHRLPEFGTIDHEVHGGLPAVDCLDLFGSAAVVVGNDTGLTHLAALCEGPDGRGPEVIGLYGRHSYAKWTTGSARHHAAATAFSQMMAVADACPVRDHLDDSLWGTASDIHRLPADGVAWLAGRCAGWW